MYEALGLFYDWFYTDEAMTRAELDFLGWAFRQHARRSVEDVFDVSCGTGRQALRLAEQGYRVTASDPSDVMLARLRQKPGAERLRILQRSMQDLAAEGEADAVISVFTAMNHLVGEEDLGEALASFHRALRPGGLAVFDMGNFLNLIGRYEKTLTRHFTRGENMADDAPWDEVRSLMTHALDDVEGTFVHREEVFARTGDTWTRHVEVAPMRVFTRREVLQDLRRAGFQDVWTYRGWADRGESRENTFRLVFVALKA